LFRHRAGQAISAQFAKNIEKIAAAETATDEARHAAEMRLTELAAFAPEQARQVENALHEEPLYSQRAVDAMLRGDQVEAGAAMTEMQKRADLMESVLDAMSVDISAEAHHIEQQAEKRAQLSARIAVAVILVAGTAGILLMLMVGRWIVRPLQITTAAILKVNAGQTEIDLPPITRDEFGAIARALRQFRDGAEKLRRMAYYDALTGIGNRAHLDEYLEGELSARRSRGGAVAIIGLDIDNFRAVNEKLGGRAGDRFLCEAVVRIRRLLPDYAQLFRHSGDKFLAVLRSDEADMLSESHLKAIAEGILRGASEPFSIGNHDLNVTMSIGIATHPADGETVEHLISSADSAIYMAKRSGGNAVRFGAAHVTGYVRKQMALAGEIRRGLQNNDFEVFYQPIVDVVAQCVVGAEALVRWRHPERGLILPGEFIQTAEDSGLINELGERVMVLAHRQAANWADQGLQLRIAVNLSARQLKESRLLADIDRMRAREQRLSVPVDFELTEGALFDTSDATASLLAELKRRGYRLGLDDFGTGYSSFIYVQRMPIDKIKIDRTFVANMHDSAASAAIISATIALARTLSLEVIAEGVETVEQMRSLAQMGCRLQQGFLFSPALPVDEFKRWVGVYESSAQADTQMPIRTIVPPSQIQQGIQE